MSDSPKTPDRTYLRWPTSPLSAFRDVEHTNILHAGRTSPETTTGICGVELWGPFGWVDAHKKGLGNIVPWEAAATRPPPHLDGGVWHICHDCIIETTTKKKEPIA